MDPVREERQWRVFKLQIASELGLDVCWLTLLTLQLPPGGLMIISGRAYFLLCTRQLAESGQARTSAWRMSYTLALTRIHTEVRSDVVEIVFPEFQHIPQNTASSPSRLLVVTKHCGWSVISGWCIPAPVPEWLPPPAEEHLGLNKAPFSPSDHFTGLARRCVIPVVRERTTRIKTSIFSAVQRLGGSPAQWFAWRCNR